MGRRQWLELPPDLTPAHVRLIKLIRGVKDDHGLTLNELAAKTHYARSSWERWLNGKRLITASAIESLARATGADSSPLLHLHAQAVGAVDHTEGSERARPPAPTPSAASPKTPQQLPVDTRVFTGRSSELAALLALAEQAGQGSETGMAVITSINGMGGVGKTALAVHAAHRMAEDFPGGQLFIDLRGYAAEHERVTVGEALDYLLRSLGVQPRAIPQDLGERAALYRSTLAGTRTLIVLDNASSTAQVRPLLPGAAGCLVLVTSRNVLMGLDDAHFVALDVLPGDEAMRLLRRVGGAQRFAADDPHAAELVTLCGHMPLAIRIVAARLRHHRFLSPAALVAELREESQRLNRLSDGERDLIGVFESSYRDLPAAERAVFRGLGLIPGADVDAYGAANLLEADHRATERLLESLLDHNLLIQHTPGRYRLHDLLRAYSRSLPGEDGDTAAVDRLARYYEGIAQTSQRLITHWARGAHAPSAPTLHVAPVIRDRAGAFAAMRAEFDNILAMIADATQHAQDSRALALIGSVGAFLNQEGRWPLAAALLRDAIRLAGALGDRRAHADALWNLGSIQRLSGELAEAVASQEQAIAVFRELGDRQGEANALAFLGMANAASGRLPAALKAYSEALPLFTALGDERGEVNIMRQLGGAKHMMGESREAQALLERSLVGSRRLGDLDGQAVSLGNLGRIQFSDGDYAGATQSFEECRELFRAAGNRHNEAQAVNELSLTAYTVGDYAGTAELCTQALQLSRELGFQSGVASALLGLGRARFALGDQPGAVDMLEQALAAEDERGSLVGQANAALMLGRVWHAAGELERARAYLERALTARQGSATRGAESEVHNAIAALLADTEGPESALDRYRLALAIARDTDRPADVARALEGVGRSLVATGERATGLENLRQAVEIYEGLGIAQGAPAAAYLASLLPGEP